jgi:aryl-alcohol dehydrogenase-like predicted oxidoreductase
MYAVMGITGQVGDAAAYALLANRHARLDPAVPIEDTIGAIVDMVTAGYVRRIGLSEVGTATIRRVAAVHSISPTFRSNTR